jgi:WD40 repeat protein
MRRPKKVSRSHCSVTGTWLVFDQPERCRHCPFGAGPASWPSGSVVGAVRLWEVPRGRPLAALQGHTSTVFAVALSADGRLLASGSGDGTVKLWETEGGACIASLQNELCYECMDITGMSGVTAAQRAALLALGAVDKRVPVGETGAAQHDQCAR